MAVYLAVISRTGLSYDCSIKDSIRLITDDKELMHNYWISKGYLYNEEEDCYFTETDMVKFMDEDNEETLHYITVIELGDIATFIHNRDGIDLIPKRIQIATDPEFKDIVYDSEDGDDKLAYEVEIKFNKDFKMEEFDKDEMKSLVKAYMNAKKELDRAFARTEHLDEDDFNEETYDLAIMVEEAKSEVIEYVEKYESNVKALRTSYSSIAYGLYKDL